MSVVMDYTKLCRACLSRNHDLRPLHGSGLDTMLIEVSCIKVIPGDGLPDTICIACVIQANQAYNFKQMCACSDITLRQIHITNGPEPSKITAICDDDDDGEVVPVNIKVEPPEQFHSDCYQETFNDDEMSLSILHTLPSEAHSPGPDVTSSHRRANIQIDSGEQNGSFSNASDAGTLNNKTTNSSSTIDLQQQHCPQESATYLNNQQPNDNQIQCYVCKMYFGDMRELFRHLNNRSPNHRANGLIEHNNDYDNLEQHSTSMLHPNDSRKQVICKICQKDFRHNYYLRLHMRMHTGEKPFQCSKCPRTFAYKCNMKKHIKSCLTYTEKPIECETRFQRKTNTDLYTQMQSQDLKFVCKICNKGFRNITYLNSHFRRHTGEKPFPCQLCPQRFSQKCNLKTHMRRHHGEKQIMKRLLQEKMHRNTQLAIGATYTQQYQNTMNSQTEVHTINDMQIREEVVETPKKPIRCEICQKTFVHMCSLSIHMRVHTNEKPYKCPICHKGFKQKGHLDVHFRLHTGDRPFKCQVCNKGFTHKSNVKIHMRIHRKHFECEICQIGFDRESDRNVHMNVHTTGETQSNAPSLDNSTQAFLQEQVIAVTNAPESRDIKVEY